MPIKIQPAGTNVYIPASGRGEKDDGEKENKPVSPKVVLAVLGAAGVTAAAVLALKNKKKPSIQNEIKRITGKNPQTQNLTPEEKEKLIKELQAKTDNPEVKAEIRKLIENGEWDKL